MKRIILLFGIFISAYSYSQNITFSIESADKTPFEGCDNEAITFNTRIAGSGSIDSVLVLDSTKTSTIVPYSVWRVNGRTYSYKVALAKGRYRPVLKVLMNNSWKEVSLTNPIIIHSSPAAFFRITTDSSQCFEGNSFGFLNLSTTGDENHKLEYTVFNVKNGQHVFKDSFHAHYPGDDTYSPELLVRDEKGCTDTYVATNKVEVKEQVGAGFKVTGKVGCPNTTIKFKNKTVIDLSKITGWDWQWTNGKRESFTPAQASTHWDGMTRDYSKHGYHSPKLIVHTNYGCSDSMTLIDAVRVERTNVKFSMLNTGSICMDDSVHFKWDKGQGVNQFKFTFGDPLSSDNNFESLNSNPSHKFTSPGSFPISLSVVSAPCPAKDTTICCVHVNGPAAITSLPCPPFCSKEQVIDKSYLMRLNADSTLEPRITRMDYGLKRLDTSYVIGGTHDNFQEIGYFAAGQGTDTVLGKYNIVYPKVDSFYNFYDSIHYHFVYRTWYRGDTIPKETMFNAPVMVGGLTHHTIHDTVKYANPNLDSLVVKFPNFSWKRRINASFGDTTYNIRAYHDDLPWISGYHPVFNPGYPYASDSLTFFWDFDDTFAQNCISTDSIPNPYCRYSREKLPQHIFKENGCFSVKLTATDPLLGCSNTSTQPIIYQKPVAGFDTSKYSEMNWEKQNRLLAKGVPLEGMGIRLEGEYGACVGNDLNPYFLDIYTDGISPSCKYAGGNFTDLSMVFDAERECSTKVYTYDANNNIVDSTYKECNWVSGNILRLLGNQWSYAHPGWKTVGVIVKGGGFTIDTFFYKNYIYLPDGNVNFQHMETLALDSASQSSNHQLFQENTQGRELDSITRINYEVKWTTNTLGNTRVDSIVFKDSLDIQSNGFVNLLDSSSFQLKPGKYVIKADGITAKGCPGIQAKEVWVGHLANFRAREACAGGITRFYDSVYYWNPKGTIHCAIISWWQNTSCIDTSNFFHSPIAARSNYMQRPKYNLPKFKEQIAWDYDNDGVIDDINPTQPQFRFTKGGERTVVMWTMDSLGHWLKTEKKIMIPDVDIKLSLAPGQTKHVCTPDFRRINYKASIFGDSLFSVSNNYTNTVIKNKDTGSVLFYFNNKIDFKLKLKVLSASGCFDSIADSNLLHFIGPRAQFTMTSDSTTCPSDSLRAINTGDTGKYEWIINGPTVISRQSTRDLNFGLSSTGSGALQLYTSQIVTDPQTQQQITCTSVYPEKKPVAFSHVYDLSADFEVAIPGSDSSVQFRIPYYSPLANYTYSIDGGRNAVITSVNGLFTVHFPSHGKHQLCVHASSMSCDTLSCDSINVQEVGIAESKPNSQAITLYPNPANDQIRITGLSNQHDYHIYDILGKISQGGSTEGNLDISALSEGVYLVSIRLDNGWRSQRLVVKR